MNDTSNKAPSAIEQVSDADMAIFVGKDWDKFEPAWRVARHKEKTNAMFGFKNFNWLCLLAAPVWFAYRKMYMVTAIYILATYALFETLYRVFNIDNTALGYGLAVGITVSSRLIYFLVSAKQILAIRQSGGTEDEIKAKLAAAGGVSNTSLAIGLLIVGLYTAYVFHYILPLTGNDMNSVMEGIQHPSSNAPQMDDHPTDGSLHFDNPNVQKK